MRFAPFLMAVLLATTSALGQQADPRVTTLLRHGVELRQQGQDEAALQEFRRADAITHEPRITAQIGLAEQALQRWLDASRHLREALAAATDDYIVRHREVLVPALQAVESHLASVSVTANADGAVSRQRVAMISIERPASNVAAPHTETVPNEPAPAGSATRTLRWVALSGGALLIVGGVVGAAVNASDASAFQSHGCSFPAGGGAATGPDAYLYQCQTTGDSMNNMRTLEIVGFAAGGALGIAALVLFLVSPPARSEASGRQANTVHCGGFTGSIGVSCGATF